MKVPRIFVRSSNVSPFVRRVISLPLRSTITKQIADGTMDGLVLPTLLPQSEFPRSRFPEGLTYPYLPRALAEMIQRNRNQLAQGLDTVVGGVGEQLGAAFNSAEGKEMHAFETTDTPARGHAKLVLTPVRLRDADPSKLIGDLNTMRAVLAGGFPNIFASVSDELAAKLAAPGRAIDGSVLDVLADSMEELRQRNAMQYAAGSPLEGAHAIGSNSIVDIAPGHHFVEELPDGRLVQAVYPMTTVFHTFGGGLLWFMLEHKTLPGHIVCGTLGVGEHGLSFGCNLPDALNEAAMTHLMSGAFSRGLALAEMMPQLIKDFGLLGAGGLGLDGRVLKRLNEEMATRNEWSNWDRGVLSTYDALSKAMVTLHLFFPDKVVGIDLQDPPKIETVDDIDTEVQRGVDRFVDDPESYAPLQTLVDTLRTGISDELAKAGGDLPWDFARRQVAAAVHDEVRQQILANEVDAAAPAEVTMQRLTQSGLRSAIARTIDEFVRSGLSDIPEYRKLADAHGEGIVHAGLLEAYATPMTMHLAAGGLTGEGYLASAVRTAVAGMRGEVLRQRAESMVSTYAAATEAANATREEASAREADLERVERQIEKGDATAEAMQRKRDLAEDLQRLREKLAGHERERDENSPQRQEDLAHEREKAEKEAEAAERTRDRIARDAIGPRE
ncbi:hypothetical protein [Paraburkholderia sp. SIMBA_054]|uniref:hypothetical protein n=1 Tax=Paraburkholderia sp. SIMBA_054 TaxID=3085795 RepID=UPI0039785B3B